MVSWDIAISEFNEPILIEFNVRGQGVAAQYAYGPLFGRFSKEILESCSINKLSIRNIYS